MIKKLLRALITIALFGFIFTAVDMLRTRPLEKVPRLPQSVMTVTGNPVDLAALSRQGPVLVYLWATWCGPCKAVSPSVAWLAKRHQVVTVALDSGSDAQLRAYLQAQGYHFTVVNDQYNQLAQAFGVAATPTVVILKNGQVSSSTLGISTPWGLWLRLWLA